MDALISVVLYIVVGTAVSLLASMSPSRVRLPALAGSGQFAGVSASRLGSLKTNSGTPWQIGDFFAIAILIIFSGIRNNVGTDFWMYDRNFQDIYTPDWSIALKNSDQEFGYTLLEYVVRSNTEWRQAIMMITSVMTIVPIYLTIKRYASNPGLAVFFYFFLAFYLMPLNIVRQGLAIGLNFAAAAHLANRGVKRGIWWFVPLNAFAATFHTSVLIAAVIQLIVIGVGLRFTLRSFAIYLGACVFAALFFGKLGTLNAVAHLLNARYDQYLKADEAGLGTYLLIAVHVTLVALCLWIGRMDRQTERWVSLVGIGILFLILGTQSIVFSRIEVYFAIFLILALSTQLAKLRPNSNTGVNDLRVLVMAGSVVYTIFYLTHYANLIPYGTRLG